MEENHYIKLFGQFLDEFQSETDRGAAILAGSMLDQKLKDILYGFLIDCKQSKDLLDGYNAPIGTFSSRLNLSFALGLISKFEFDECSLVRKIRNEFAHKFELAFSFADKKVSSICQNFQAGTPGDRKDFTDKPRFLFINGTISLYINLMYREEYVRKRKLVRPDWHEITWQTKNK